MLLARSLEIHLKQRWQKQCGTSFLGLFFSYNSLVEGQVKNLIHRVWLEAFESEDLTAIYTALNDLYEQKTPLKYFSLDALIEEATQNMSSDSVHRQFLCHRINP